MKSEFEQLKEVFRAEATELLAELETSLIELEKTPDDKELISSVFRVFHTLKGSGAMCGFDDVSAFTHHIETVYDLVRNSRIVADKALIDLTLSSCDLIRGMIDGLDSASGEKGEQAEHILSSFQGLIQAASGAEQSAERRTAKAAEKAMADQPESQVTYRIRFRPAQEIFSNGTNPLLLLNDLRRMGKAEVIAYTEDIPGIYDIDPEKCYTWWDVILTTGRSYNEIRDVFIFVEDECELRIDVVDDGESQAGPQEYSRLGEILIEKSDLRKEDLEKVLKERKLIGELLVDQGLVHPLNVQAALTEQEQVKQIRENRQKAEAIMNVRVPSKKLDKLVNLVGELVTVQARLTQTSSESSDPVLVSIAEEVERLTAELRDTTMDIRMMPIGATFSTFKRLVRDLSKDLGKEVELIATGGETELDKTVIEKLNDPLVHLIRNCVDHGIELPEVREKAGKSRKGSVHLGAAHSGDHVIIQIQDDGAGLDAGEIRSRAIKMGMISPEAELTEHEIFDLVLAPGFSMAENVTRVSGRGVGMDVVKKAVDSLRGTLHIESMKGHDTTFTLVLPLTLAIIDGLLVKAGGECFVLPLSDIEECVELTRKNASEAHGRHMVNVRGAVVPYIRMREQFALDGEAPEREQLVIIKANDRRVGFVVDSVIGEHQTVIKSLGRIFRDIEGISGATILGDGSVALIMDVEKLIKIVEDKEVQTAF